MWLYGLLTTYARSNFRLTQYTYNVIRVYTYRYSRVSNKNTSTPIYLEAKIGQKSLKSFNFM